MSKTLIVSFLPRGERSNTRKIVETFKAAAAGKTEFIERELSDTPASLMLRERTMAYIMRDFVGEQKPEYDTALSEYDALISELKSADFVILAYPMWNFSVPAAVKAWVDAVALKGHTWTIGDKGYVGLLTGKKGLIITTSGGEYAGTPLEHAQSLTKAELEFIGIPADIIAAPGINAKPDQAEAIVAEAEEKARKQALAWYGA